MSDESTKTAGGALGRLPKWPRKALNNSVISAEQAYRQRSGLPLLTDADIEALRTGVPMPWEAGDGSGASAPAAPATAAPATPAAPTAAASVPATPATPTPSASGTATGISPEVAAIVATGKKWSKSSVAAEQARRQRKGLPALNDAEITALLGKPAAAPAAAAPAAATPGTSAPAATAPAAPAAQKPLAPAVARTGQSTTYVGTPAVGTSKAAAAGGLADTSSLALAYHLNGNSLGDTIDVINRTNGVVLKTLFGLYFGESFGRQSLLSGSHKQMKRLEYIYTDQNDHSLGSALLTDYFFLDSNGNTNATYVLGQMQYVVTTDSTHATTQVCTATFTTLRPWKFGP